MQPDANELLKSTFLAETEDLLAQMEDGLLCLEERPDDKEVLNAIFRSGHTVKGSAGLLNFREIVSFTHVLENVLDRLRKSELRIDDKLISILLAGKDVIAEMLVCVAEDRPVVESPACGETTAALRLYSDLRAQAPASISPVLPSAIANADASALRTYCIEICLKDDILERGQDPYMLLLELGDLGEILKVEARVESVPSLDLIDVFKCYFTWSVLLHGHTTLQRLEDVFVFVKEEGSIKIRAVLDCSHWV